MLPCIFFLYFHFLHFPFLVSSLQSEPSPWRGVKIEIWGCRLETRNGCLQSAVARRPRAEVSGWQNLGLELYSPVSSLQSPVSILRIGNLGLGLYSPVCSLQSPIACFPRSRAREASPSSLEAAAFGRRSPTASWRRHSPLLAARRHLGNRASGT